MFRAKRRQCSHNSAEATVTNAREECDRSMETVRNRLLQYNEQMEKEGEQDTMDGKS